MHRSVEALPLTVLSVSTAIYDLGIDQLASAVSHPEYCQTWRDEIWNSASKSYYTVQFSAVQHV